MPLYPAPIVHSPRNGLPVLLSVPHSGRNYEDALLANAVQGRRSLETLEDPLVDRLVWRAVSAGFGAVVQPVPRAVIDCNRDEEEVDPAAVLNISPAPVGPRARHGLGLVPSRTHRHGRLWRQPIQREELKRRIEQVHRPYHEAVAGQLSLLAELHGEALLIDCHSMPPRNRGQAEIVIGDRHGTSSAGWVGEEAAAIAQAAGFQVQLNDPYAGGAIVARHGRPDAGIHAIQLEIDRSTYLEGDGRTPGKAFDRVACFIERLAAGLGQASNGRAIAIAAE